MITFSADCPVEQIAEVLESLRGMTLFVATVYGVHSHVYFDKLAPEKRLVFRGKDAVIVHLDDIIQIKVV